MAPAGPPDKPMLSPPSSLTLFLSFLRLGSVSFGGPAMVAYIKRLAVQRNAWLSEDDFQQGVALCQAVPGATAMQCAAYVGLRIRGLPGAIATYTGFGLPAVFLMLSLSIAYHHAVQFDVVTSALVGLRALVVGLVANATWTFARPTLKRPRDGLIAVATAVPFFLGGNPFLIVVAAGLAGTLLLRPARQPAVEQTGEGATGREGEGGIRREGDPARSHEDDSSCRRVSPSPPLPLTPSPNKLYSLRAPALVFAFGAAVIVALLLFDRSLAGLGIVMMKVDAFAFGGGFASVPLMFREIVDARHWLPSNVFMDGIALGQITPGPIVITATFVGYQVAKLPGALVATVCVFLPSLFVLVLLEPSFRRLRASATFQGATRGLVLSFVGLLASVTMQFAILTHWTVPSAIIGGLALAALLLKVDVVWVVLAGAVLSALIV